MSQENVEAFKRGVAALNRGDIEALLDECDPEVRWRDAISVMFGGQATLYEGHHAVRDLYRDLYASFDEIDAQYSDIRDLWRARGGLGPPPRAGQGKRSGDRVPRGLGDRVRAR